MVQGAVTMSLIFRKYKTQDKVELSFDNIDLLSVLEVREIVSSTMGVPLDDLKLVYGGRVLKPGKKVSDYKVVAGCTIYVMTSKPKISADEKHRTKPDKLGLLGNRRVLTMIGRVLSNPVVLQDIMQGTPMGENSAMLQVLGSPEVIAHLSDPDNIQEYIRDNPPVAAMIEHLIQQFLGSEVDSVAEMDDEEQLVDMLEGHLEEGMAQVEREGEVQRAMAQEQMFEHSQALHAHHQQQQQQQHQLPSQSPSLPATASPLPLQQDSVPSSWQHSLLERQNTSRGGGGGGSGITREQLAMALANAMEATPMIPVTPQPSPLRSLDVQASSHTSLPLELPPPPYSTPLPSMHTSHLARGYIEDPVPNPGPISPSTLQQALAEVVRSTRTESWSNIDSTGSRMDTRSSRLDNAASHTSSSDSSSGRMERSSALSGRPEDDREVLAHRYREQLEQLHLMGIMDDTACLHALMATEGDLQAALEILYSK